MNGQITFPCFLTHTGLIRSLPSRPACLPGRCLAPLGLVWMLRSPSAAAAPQPTGFPGRSTSARQQGRRLVELIATVGPLDIDTPIRAITVMMPDED